ncbi:MAG: MerR family transcriptional regulator [Clostridiales Family XIII bacterium]|nr:MerR family transcriptional regulator [Clostridiales Family XIII bacterium]
MATPGLLSIKDFSNLTRIKQSTLRYYDNIGLFKPSKRGANGYRYYSLEQITTINLIIVLNNLGMTIDEINGYMTERTPELMSKVFLEKETELYDQIRVLTERFNIVGTYRRLINLGLFSEENKMTVEYREERKFSLGKRNRFTDDTYFSAFFDFIETAKIRNVDLNYPIGGYFDDIDDFVDHASRPDYFYSVDPNGVDLRPAGMHIVCFIRGDYGEVGDVATRLVQFAKENHLVFTGPIYNTYVEDEISIVDPNHYLLEILAPVRKEKEV